jgi:hypothetical protein
MPQELSLLIDAASLPDSPQLAHLLSFSEAEGLVVERHVSVVEQPSQRSYAIVGSDDTHTIALAPLDQFKVPEDLSRTVYIRAEPHTVGQALNRHLAHLAYHVGQIVLLAKHWAGSRWQSLTIPRGQSRAFAEAKHNQHSGGLAT